MAPGQLRGVVALDGPSGTGKSTVARRLAGKLGAGYLDTGAMYRAITVAVLRAGVDPSDDDAVAAIAERTDLHIGDSPAAAQVRIGDDDVTVEIRGPEVTLNVSAVSAVPRVRELMVARQRSIITDVVRRLGGIVVEGRDIGTVVAPDAPLKVYLTASADARAGRRTRQDAASGRNATIAETRKDVERRDRLDSTRTTSPLRPAHDAVELDTTALDINGVLNRLVGLLDERGLRGQACEAGGR
ncbi:cytidylate kinase [Labedaea rhizosphaerae]|uniref:Cytidylate kinase n=1 Tax=Labedaea rhizosphaerae TaxID=598644 RepID=A0A4R6RU90_LABRH|nr:(d)CMP kinase [Labedaea rhizosphaerae]TDP90501.1 cytidylate kinase [Labedaea rhizosphaerae]